ncbi:MAG: NAD(P)H-dependent oxidoreductase subunit E, partial [Lachnospiraceae bacterium]
MKRQVLVCCGTGCRANGSMKVVEAMESCVQKKQADAEIIAQVKKTGCNGLCESGPMVTILPEGIIYYKVRPEDAEEIVEKTIMDGEPVERLLYRTKDGKRVLTQKEHPFYKEQDKMVLQQVGKIDPESIEDYIASGGYEALKKALSMTPDQIIQEVEISKIRGRGGAGFPTGKKWRTAAGYEQTPKYVICNGDEGDPGAFMDGSVLEGNPHVVIEGLAIAAIAIGAEEGFFYIRDEYNLPLKHMKKAMMDAEKRGIIGDSMMGSTHSLKLSIVRGGGAFVCGESTALMASIAGRVGEPRAKYIR